MPEVSFSNEDILAGKKMETGWRRFRIKSIIEKKGSKDPNSITWEVDAVCSAGPDQGVPIRFWFSEKMMKFLVAFVSVFGEVKAGAKLELNNLVGKECEIMTVWNPDQKSNEAKEYRRAA